MATGRKISFSSHVVATKSLEMEETAVRKTEFQSGPGKALGGKGVAIVNATQWGDAWSTESHPLIQKWEEFTTNWEDILIYPNLHESEYTVTTTGANHRLTTDSNDLAFLYIENTGSTNNCLVSLQGEVSAKYLIVIPPKASIALRGDGTTLDCNDVYVKSNTGTTTIQYLIAKE